MTTYSRDHDELVKLEAKPVVFSSGEPFEKPAESIEDGPYYKWAEEKAHDLNLNFDEEIKEQKTYPLDRRNFMKLFSLASVAAASACVRRPTEHAITYVNQPVDFVPGVAQHYHTTCGACPANCGVTVKTREGRPVKLEGHKEHPISMGALCGLGQAQLQSLYHPERLKAPKARHGGRLDDVTWDEAFDLIGKKVKDAKKVAILTGGTTGHLHGFYQEFLDKMGSDHPDQALYTFEPNSLYANISKAHEEVFGHGDLPRIELEEARFILGIGVDFLEVGTSPVFHSKGFVKARTFDGKTRGHFVQCESQMSLTGGKADERHVIPPGSEWATALLLLHALFNEKSSHSTEWATVIHEFLKQHDQAIQGLYQEIGLSKDLFVALAKSLYETKSVVMAGGGGGFDQNGTLTQVITIYSNLLLGAYGSVLYFDQGWHVPPVKAGDISRFMAEAKDIDCLFVIGINPVFALPQSFGLLDLMKKIPTVVSIQSFPNEVDECAEFVLPSHHYLESWGDEQPAAGLWSLRQPVVRPTTGSRQAEDMLLWIAAYADKPMGFADFQAYIKHRWVGLHEIFGIGVSFDQFFHEAAKKGFLGRLAQRAPSTVKKASLLDGKLPSLPKDYVLVSPLDHRFMEGRGAHLPILHEIGDPMTTVTWDQALSLHPETMRTLGLKPNQVVELETLQGLIKAAIYPLPGLHPQTLLLKRGNGHKDKRSTISCDVGVNPLDLYPPSVDPYSAEPQTSCVSVKIKVPQEKIWHRLAAMQKHNDIAGRKDIIKTISEAALITATEVDLDTVPDLFPALETKEHLWGMSIDLDKCTGCGACMVACTLENNVPQVGREQIMMGREMHWIRLDRYFAGDFDHPTVTFQPIMCQHCAHAPCEAVCPVFATTHDPEGLNAMTYNRCVGTRYCANGCPYKVRRFNWWTHKWNEMGERLQDRNPRALNPDVTVRTRGVMEKCSFCVGRLRDAKHEAKKQDRLVDDGQVQTACQQTCPSDAIVFGNRKDQGSQISAKRKDPRAYSLLGGDPKHGHYGLKTLPSVTYLAKITQKDTHHSHA